jgi:ADP-dependent NAD(P)H-hydrate dehydratase / NAD(P)H-hydrate epimerase
VQGKIITQLLARRHDSHKYEYGHVLVIGGSPGMVGAPLLVGRAAMRTGAGLVTIASTAEVIDKLETRVEEIMTLTLPSTAPEAVVALQKFVADRSVSVLVVGPGLTSKPASIALVKHFLHNTELPMIIDAGGLTILHDSLGLDQLDNAASGAILLTPHVGELQRLTDTDLPAKRSALKPIAIEFARKHKVTLVLKGQPTYVAHSHGSLYENTTGNPGLATAGTGDVLSGVIAGMIAQHIEPQRAAEAGVYLHGLAGDIAAANKTEPGMIASDVIEAIPVALKSATGTRPTSAGREGESGFR